MFSVRSSIGSVALLVAALAVPSAAAADAPYRITGIDLTGNQSHEASAVAVGPAGKEILFNGWADRSRHSPQPLVRDVVAGKTISLAGTNSSISISGASDDLTKVIVWTNDSLDPVDTNQYGDQYLIDRSTGKITLLSRVWPSGEAYGGYTYAQFALSRDGKVAYRTTHGYGLEPQLIKIDLETKATTTLGSSYLRGQQIDTAGKLVFTEDKLLAGGQAIDIPEGVSFASPDGTTAAIKTSGGLTIVDVAAGTKRDAVLADFLKTNPWTLLGVANGGGTAYAGAVVTTAGVKKYAVATLDTRTGALKVVRSDIPWVPQSGAGVLSADLQFIGFGTHVAQLGSTPIQGPTVAIPEIPNNEFVPFYPGCSYGGLYAELIRPSVVLRGISIGINTRRPTKADVTVTLDRNGAIANKFTIVPGQRRSLTAGWGGFSVTSKVTYSDGTTTTGTRKVPTYRPIKNDYNPLNGGASNCYYENGLY